MATQSSSTVIRRLDLGSTFQEFDLEANRQGYIGAKIFRPFPTRLQSSDVPLVPIEALLQTGDDVRAPSGGYNRGDFKYEKFSYSTDEHGWEEPMDARMVDIHGDIIEVEQIHADRAKNIVLQNYEIACAAAAYNTTTHTVANTRATNLTNEWDDHDNATPINDIQAAKEAVKGRIGRYPRDLIINAKQRFHLGQCAQIIERIKYSGLDDPKKVTDQALAAVLDLDTILVGGAGGTAVYNTANPGQDASLADVWNDEYALLTCIAKSNDLKEVCYGRTFMWTGDGNPSGSGPEGQLAVTIEQYEEPSIRSDIYRARNDRDIKIIYADAAQLLQNVITI